MLDDVSNVRPTHVERTPEAEIPQEWMNLSDKVHVGTRQASVVVLLATAYPLWILAIVVAITARLSVAFYHVVHVVLMCPSLKVSWIHAVGDIARVKYHHPFWDWSHAKFVSDPVCVNHTPFVALALCRAHIAVSAPSRSSRPEPAVGSFFDLLPKAVSQWSGSWSRSLHTFLLLWGYV